MLLQRPNAPTLTAVTLAAIAFSAGIYAVMGFINTALQPFTIIDLEFASTAPRLADMVAVWGTAGIDAARQSLWLDFGFIPAYVLAFAGVTLIVARFATGGWQQAALNVMWLPVVAGLLDASENIALLSSLPPAPAGALTIAAVCAGLKFALLGVTLIFIVAALARRAIAR